MLGTKVVNAMMTKTIVRTTYRGEATTQSMSETYIKRPAKNVPRENRRMRGSATIIVLPPHLRNP